MAVGSPGTFSERRWTSRQKSEASFSKKENLDIIPGAKLSSYMRNTPWGGRDSQQPVCGTSLHIREGQALAPCMSVGQWTGGVCRRHGSVTLLGWNSRCLRAGGMTVRMQTWCSVKVLCFFNTGSAKGLRMSGIWAWNPLPFAEMRGEASRGHPGRRGSVQSTAG